MHSDYLLSMANPDMIINIYQSLGNIKSNNFSITTTQHKNAIVCHLKHISAKLSTENHYKSIL